MFYVYDDGGRKAAGFKGDAGDCVTRAVAIATGKPYAEVYKALATGNAAQRITKRSRATHGRRTAAHGISTKRKWFKDYMTALGWRWTPTMGIGTGCKVHLHDSELPMGRLIVAVSKHYTTVIDGVIHDTHDPQRETHCVKFGPDDSQPLKPGHWRYPDRECWIERRCVYGYWAK